MNAATSLVRSPQLMSPKSQQSHFLVTAGSRANDTPAIRIIHSRTTKTRACVTSDHPTSRTVGGCRVLRVARTEMPSSKRSCEPACFQGYGSREEPCLTSSRGKTMPVCSVTSETCTSNIARHSQGVEHQTRGRYSGKRHSATSPQVRKFADLKVRSSGGVRQAHKRTSPGSHILHTVP
ncbi:hypothetical protein K491DRAFT_39261 [Lophiostoma macrostomum CBS 122681]|uniref:Uncharacterized protein n=1 Tax=Lophiostoma macrostomum CBS 122681 TaxID=1314788 RepID=A0A6A6TLM5_9PLEO|nr:hypothetical protein K491DRAFT_39261 [Lophiostoma macrostomum CBS 122681]